MNAWRHEAVLDWPAGLDALAAYRAMTQSPPGWLAVAFRVRDALCRPFGLQPIGGFAGAAPAVAPLPGDRLDFFTVDAIAADQLTVSHRDRHLDVEVALSRHGLRGNLVTSVTTHNLLGRVYMLPVGLAHPMVVAALARRLATRAADARERR
jgi:hypothetical protein